MVKLLVEHIESLDVEIGGQKILRMVNLVKDTALHVAVRYGKYEVVEELIKGDPELAMSINKAGESALFLAVGRKFYEIASQILSAAPEYSLAGRDGMNVLHAIALRSSRKSLFFFDKKLENSRSKSLLLYSCIDYLYL